MIEIGADTWSNIWGFLVAILMIIGTYFTARRDKSKGVEYLDSLWARIDLVEKNNKALTAERDAAHNENTMLAARLNRKEQAIKKLMEHLDPMGLIPDDLRELLLDDPAE